VAALSTHSLGRDSCFRSTCRHRWLSAGFRLRSFQSPGSGVRIPSAALVFSSGGPFWTKRRSFSLLKRLRNSNRVPKSGPPGCGSIGAPTKHE
jgi:hypothetical protein